MSSNLFVYTYVLLIFGRQDSVIKIASVSDIMVILYINVRLMNCLFFQWWKAHADVSRCVVLQIS